MENRHPKIYLIAGKARNGKDTVADFIIDEYNKRNKKVLRLSYGEYIKTYVRRISGWDGNEETKPRALLQTIGTDLIRNQIDELMFVRRICEDIKVYSYFFDALVISDVRLKNEIEVPEKEFDNIFKIKVIRPNFESSLKEKEKSHRTECELDNYNNYDKIFINDGTIEQLGEKVKKYIEVIENEH